MRSLVSRTATIAGAIVAAACVYDAPLTPTGNTITAANVSNTSAAQLAGTVSRGPTSSSASNRYVVLFRAGSAASAAVSAEVQKTGGLLEGAYDDPGFAVISGVSNDAVGRLASINGVADVLPDVEFTLESSSTTESLGTDDAGIASAESPQTATQFARQWGMRAIQADAAWRGEPSARLRCPWRFWTRGSITSGQISMAAWI